MELYKFRVPEELYDFTSDPDGLVNLIDDPDVQAEKQRLKGLLHAQMKGSDDPLADEFRDRFMQ